MIDNNNIIDKYYKQVNIDIIKFNQLLNSILGSDYDGGEEIDIENIELNKEILNVIENKILVYKEKNATQLENKSKLLNEINQLMVLLDDNNINQQYNNLIESISTIKLSKQLDSLTSFKIHLNNEYKNNEIILNKEYSKLVTLYQDLGIDLETMVNFKVIGDFKSSRIKEVQDEIKRLNEIRDGIHDKLKLVISNVLELQSELELPKETNVNITNLIESGDIKKLISMLMKFEKLVSNLLDIKESRILEISNLNQSIQRDYKLLEIPETDSERIKFKNLKSPFQQQQPLSNSLLSILVQESQYLLSLKKLKYKDSFRQKFKTLDSLWDQLCIPIQDRNLNKLLNINSNDGQDESIYYTIESFETMDMEIITLNKLLDSMKSILVKVKRREWIKCEMKKFETNLTNDPKNRFKGSSVKLLEEAKFRKLIAREYPVLTNDLIKELADWESTNEKRFLYFGNPYLELMNSETERPDFDLLHLKLLSKKDHIDSDSNNINPLIPMVSSTPISKKPSPLIKRSSLSSFPKTTSTTTPSTPTLTKTVSAINLSPSTKSPSTKSPLSSSLTSISKTATSSTSTTPLRNSNNNIKK